MYVKLTEFFSIVTRRLLVLIRLFITMSDSYCYYKLPPE